MDLLQLLILLVVAGICGAVAEWIVGYSPGGLLLSVILGVIGAYLGMWLASLLSLPTVLPIRVGTVAFDLIWATLGTIIFLLLLYTLRGGRRWRLFGSRP